MNEYGRRVNKKMQDYMGDPDSVSEEIHDILNAGEGIQVRGALAAGVSKSFNKSVIAEQRSSVGLENKVVDGNFTNGLEEHYVSRQRAEFINGNVILTGEASDISTGIVTQRLANQIPVDENWYFISRIRALDDFEWIGVGVRGSSGLSTSRVYYPDVMEWYTISHYMSGNDYNDLSGNFSAATWGGTPNALGKRVEVEYYMAFNLTEAFGRGNEPSKEEMDNLLLNHGYFEGDLGSWRLINKLIQGQLELIDGQLELESEITKIRYSDLENVLKQDRSNWVSWSHSSTSQETNGNLTVEGNGNSSIVATLQHFEGYFKAGHKFYVSGDFKPNKELSNYGFGLLSGRTSPIPINYLRETDVIVNEWKTISGVIDVAENSDYVRLQIRTIYPSDGDSDGGKTELRNLFAFDLTSYFGEGNEPSTEGFELMLKNLDIKEGKMEVVETQKALTQLTFSEMKKKSEVSTRLERPLAVVSFDDQNLSDYEKAFPFLRARGIKGTSYIITSTVGNPGKMDWDHLHELKNAGWDIEFHTHNHINLEQSSDSVIRQDFEQGIQTFKDNGFPKPRHLAYPYGAGTDSDRVRNVIGEYMKTARNSRSYFSGVNNSYDEIDFLRMGGLSIDMNEHRQDRIEKIKEMMEYSAENNEIVFLYAHKLVDSAPTNDNTPETIFDMWAELIDYAIDLDFEFVTTNEMYLRVR